MGMCGADPVWVVAGAEALSAPTPTERATLDRLGLGPACRLACCARVQGSVSVALDRDAAAADGHPVHPTADGPAVTSTAPAFAINPEIRRVVVIGGGVAGTTAATEVRRLHPAATVTVLGAEPYDAYNRMAVDRLLSTSRLDKLYLLPRDWAARRGIRALCGVEVTAIDRAERRVHTQDGAVLPYDRLVLAMGAGSTVPTLQGYGMPGSFVLRTADDAWQLAAYIRDQRPRAAVVLGGGPVGLEAADKLREKGREVTVLDRNPWPLARHLDRQAGSLLRRLLEERGIRVIAETTACQLVGGDRLRRVICADGLCLDAGLCLVAVGTAANTSLAAAAGLAVRRGVIVDDHLRTSDPDVYAVGDVAEHEGHIAGLWQAGIEQARVASVNLLGGDVRYQPMPVPPALKVSGIDLLAVGTLTPPKDGGQAICFEHHAARTYWKLVTQAGTARGAVAIGDPDLAGMLARLVARRVDLEQALAGLERGDWSVIAALLPDQERGLA
jgi:nitrite reductase (NADH) large subunit